MARFLAFVVSIYSLVLTIHGQTLANLMTIQPGTVNGGCDARATVLDEYAAESLESVLVAIRAIEEHGEAETNTGKTVRRALATYFKIAQGVKPSATGRKLILQNLNNIAFWFEETLVGIEPSENFLYCDSTFMVQQAVTAQAMDLEGNGIKENEQSVPISTAYAAQLTESKVPWWTGTHTPLNAYFFAKEDEGGNWCNKPKHEGTTIKLEYWPRKGQDPTNANFGAMILCPITFDGDRPATWAAGSSQITEGMSLEKVLPKSTTLLHEAFHVINGDDFLFTGEYYPLSECLDRKRTTQEVRTNPESYVYFVATMYYLLGSAPEIPSNWDFSHKPGEARRVSP